jgi:hypothetical protein
MASYEVTAASEPSERLVVSVGGATLVFGPALDEDREAAERGDGVVIMAEQSDGENGNALASDSADLASDLNLLRERVPEVAEVVEVRAVAEPAEAADVEKVVTTVHPVDPPDTVVPAGETSPGLEREVVSSEDQAEKRDESTVQIEKTDTFDNTDADRMADEGGRS